MDSKDRNLFFLYENNCDIQYMLHIFVEKKSNADSP